MTKSLHLGFLLYEYFPYGGLQRDCVKTALACVARGHQVLILTRSWDGPRPAGVHVECLGQRGWTNVRRDRHWLRQTQALLPQRGLDGIVGFNKLPGLDVYFGADPCYVSKMQRLRPAWYRCFPRYHFHAAMEQAVFSKGQRTQILLLTDHEIPSYTRIYGTERERFHLLPPGIARHHFDPAAQAEAREALRRDHGWDSEERLMLFVGSGFRVKGLDRAIAGLASLPQSLRERTRLLVIGQGRPASFMAQARRAGVRGRVNFCGAREDVPRWLLGADLLLHPAYSESAGMVLLEAMTCGLPVLTTDTCGYAFHVERADAGVVLRSPFLQEECNRVLREMLSSTRRLQWSANGLAYAKREDLYSCHDKAAGWIERILPGGVSV